jgi:nucleotide-binding universal stress UspA family protein
MTTEAGPGRRVVVGIDGSAESLRALGWAASYAAATGATVEALLSWHYPAEGGVTLPGAAPKSVSHEVGAAMQAALDRALTEVYGTAAPAKVHTTIAYGHPAEMLIDASKDADLLVVGNRGQGAFTGMSTGSVSMHCVNQADCPVVVVRGTECGP